MVAKNSEAIKESLFPREVTYSVEPLKIANLLAEGVGFEPTRDFHPCRFSRPVPSTTRPPLQAIYKSGSFDTWSFLACSHVGLAYSKSRGV